MHYLALTTALLAAAIGTTKVNALGCYTSGLSYSSVSGDNSVLASARTDACYSLAGSYSAGGTKTYCSTIGDNRINWAVTNNAGSELTLSASDCVAAMTIEMNACSMGSVQNHGSFQYKDDPNAGAC